MFKPFEMAFLAIYLALMTAPAFADSCDVARHEYDYSDDTRIALTKKETGAVMNSVGQLDPVEGQKASCKLYKAMIDSSEDHLRRMRNVDNACGSRIYWEKCGTACFARYLEDLKKTTAYECDPARITEIREKAAARDKKEKDERAELIADMDRQAPFAEACLNLTPYHKNTASSAEWDGWIKKCNQVNANYRNMCVIAWLDLEKHKIPTTGMTCAPTAKERSLTK